MSLRYAVAACQTDFGCPRSRDEVTARVNRMLEMVDSAVFGYEPFFPVRLVVPMAPNGATGRPSRNS